MIFMKKKKKSLAMHHGASSRKFFIEFQSIMEVSKLPWLQEKEYQE